VAGRSLSPSLLLSSVSCNDGVKDIVLWALYNFCKSKGWLPKKSLKGEHAYITGGGSGLGRLMAIRLV